MSSDNTHNHMPTMISVMTPFPYQIESTASLQDARQMMAKHDIHHLAVTENGVLESIISNRDIDSGHFRMSQQDRELSVSDVCPAHTYIVDAHDPLDRVLDAMTQTHIGAVLITREGELAGIFTRQDACRLLAGMLRQQHHEPPPDQVA